MSVERKELLLARGLGKSFSERGGLAHTVAQRLWRLGKPPERVYVFEKADFTLLPGECVALVGGNGSGKSTFLRCLAGLVEPTDGEVLRIGKFAALLSHGFGAYEDLPVSDNLLLAQQLIGSTLKQAEANLEKVAAMAELTGRLYSPTSHLSEGMRAKIALCALAHSDFQVALLDENLNYVDKDFRDLFFDLTRKWIAEGRSLVITSHDGQVLHKFATRFLCLRSGRLEEMN
ncbi:MAG TPA: ATP-binding cassette domain-containing protein [Bdellovibrionota bacterium]|jgi:ABC-type polysaccharide/polyol phosphate transport system ATPase subunit